MDPIETIQKLEKLAGFSKAYYSTKFTCYRKKRNGEDQEVQVEILDSGTENSGPRYLCFATTKDGKASSGNPSSTIDALLATVHWGKLE